MISGKYSNAVVAAAIAIFAAIILISLYGWTSTRALFCSAREANCFRDWVAATSGWAAAAAAAATLRYLHRQSGLMQRQTEFLVGDRLPSLGVAKLVYRGRIRVSITNWNHTGVVLGPFAMWVGGKKVKVEYQRLVGEGSAQAVEPAKYVGLKGWQNRSLAPDQARGFLQIVDEKHWDVGSIEASITLDYHLSNDRAEKGSITATVNLDCVAEFRQS